MLRELYGRRERGADQLAEHTLRVDHVACHFE